MYKFKMPNIPLSFRANLSLEERREELRRNIAAVSTGFSAACEHDPNYTGLVEYTENEILQIIDNFRGVQEMAQRNNIAEPEIAWLNVAIDRLTRYLESRLVPPRAIEE